MTTTTEARIYVGTYAKYNSGSIAGRWLDLSDYSDKEEFYAACADLHADESDPEFMFQDWEGIPEGMIGESWLSDSVFEWLELDGDDRELIEVFREAIGNDYGDIQSELEAARDAFHGTAESEADFAENLAHELGEVPESLPAWISIDWEGSWNGGLRFDYATCRHNGEIWFFLNH